MSFCDSYLSIWVCSTLIVFPFTSWTLSWLSLATFYVYYRYKFKSSSVILNALLDVYDLCILICSGLFECKCTLRGWILEFPCTSADSSLAYARLSWMTCLYIFNRVDDFYMYLFTKGEYSPPLIADVADFSFLAFCI